MPEPPTSDAVRMSWAQLAFLHWRVDPTVMRALVPRELELDLFDGSAWVGLVPFTMRDCHFRGFSGLPGLSNFHECNVRTYVARGERRGVWFFSLDAQTLLPVLGGRWMWNLNYVYSRFDVARRETGRIDYSLARRIGPWPSARTRISWTPGEALPPSEPGSLEHFLTERYWLYTRRRSAIWRGEVRHAPWSLRSATLHELEDSLVASAGLRVEGAPHVMASDNLNVTGEGLVLDDLSDSRVSNPHPSARRSR